MKILLAGVSALTIFCLGIGQSATLPNTEIVGPAATASIAEAHYCFARDRGLDPARMPPSYLVLELHVRVSYKNSGTRPLIMPWSTIERFSTHSNRDR